METKRIAEDGAVGKNEDRLWRSVFAVQVALTEITTKKYNNRREQVLAVIWNIVDGLQLLALVIGRFSGFDAGVTRPLLSWLDLHNLFTQHTWEGFTKTFWVYFTVTLYVILAFGYYILRQSKGKGRDIQIYMSMAARCFIFGLYIPYLKLYANVFACGQDDLRPALPTDPESPNLFVCLDLQWTVYAAVSGAILAFFLTISLLYFFLFRHNHIDCPDFESRPHGRFHAVYALARVAMVAATIAVPTTNVIACIVSLGCTAYPLLLNYKFLPSYKPLMNYIRGGFLASATFLALASCVLTSVGQPGEANRALGSAVALAIAGFMFAVGLALMDKLSRVEDVANMDLKTHFDAELAVRVLLHRDHSPPAVAKAEAIYRYAITEFPTTVYLQLQLANLLKAFVNNQNAAYAEIRIGWRKEPTIDYRYELHATKLFWERQAQLYNSQTGQVASADLFSSADAKKQYESARQSHTKTLKLTRQFWMQLTKKNLHVVGALDDVPRRLADIHHVALTAENAYVVLIKRYGSSKILLRSYASFLEHCLNDKARAQLYYMKADEVEESESKTASLSASQSQSQSQSQSAGGGMQSASESQSASSGASSSAAAKKRAANKELKLRSNETKAVKRLFWGVIVGLLLLGGLACAMFIAVKLLFVEYSQNNNRLRFISFQRRRVVAVNNMIRWMHLGAITNNSALFKHWASEVGIRSKDFSYDHRGLYFGYDSGVAAGMPPSTNPEIVKYWKDKETAVVLHYPGPPVYEIKEKQTIWDAGNTIMIMCRRISLMNPEHFRDIAKIREVKYVFQNALFGILDALNVGAGVYEDDVMNTIEKAKYILLAICLFSCLTLLCEALFVFRPSFKKVRVTMRGVSDILEGIPRPLLKQVAKYYSKAQKRDREGDSEEEGEEGGKGGNSSDSSRSSKSGRSGASDDEGRPKSARRAKKERRRPSKDDASDSEGDKEEKKERRKKGKKEKRDKASKKGKKYEAEAKKGAGEASETDGNATQTLAEADEAAASGGEERKPHRTESKLRAQDLAALEAPVAPAAAAAAEDASARAAGSRGGSAGSRRASAPPSRGSDRQRLMAGSVAAGPARAPAVVGDLEVTSAPLRDILEGLAAPEEGGEGASSGRAGGRSDAGSLEAEVLAVPELQEDASGAAVHVLRGASAEKGGKGGKEGLELALGGKLKSGSFNSSVARNSASSGSDDERAAAAKRRSRTASIQLTQKPKLGRINSTGGAGGGILRKVAEGVAQEEDSKAHAHKVHEHKKTKEGAESSGDEGKKKEKKGKDSDDEKQKEKEKERKKKKEEKKKQKGDEGEKQGADILTKLTYKYTASFFVIAGIFIINFVVCFVILDAGKNYSYEINLAGRRRSIAREVAFYARELYINDGIFLERDDIYGRLVKKAALFKEIHQALKFGDTDLHVLGANGRNKQLDEVMYMSTCLRINEAKCTEGRVTDMQLVVNGLDALVIGVVDLITEILQETAPDLLLTGKEDPSVVRHKNYELTSTKLELLMEIDDGDLDDGLNQAAAAFVAESLTSMGVIEMMEALILTFVILFLAALYIYLFAPMLARLGEETGRAGQILKMVPKDVVLKARALCPPARPACDALTRPLRARAQCVHLHHYFVGIGKEDEDE
eukprot:tig00000949_g5756.t1